MAMLETRGGSITRPGSRLGAGGPALWSCSVQPRAGSPYSAASISFTGVFWGIKGFSKGSSSGVSDNLPLDKGEKNIWSLTLSMSLSIKGV